MKYILSIFLLTFTFSFGEVIVKETVRTVEGVGVGLSRSEAVNNAIAEACGQINGVQVNATKFISDTTVETSTSAKSEFIFNKQVHAVTKGKVDSYSIVDVFENNGEYEATVSVTKTTINKHYKVPGLDKKKRRSVAVIQPFATRNIYNVANKVFAGYDTSKVLSHELVNSITKTRKFNVLDRDNIIAYQKEQKIILSSNSSTDELLKLGKVMGADYLLVTKIAQLDTIRNNNTKQITASFNSSNSHSVKAIVEYRIIAMATRQVKWSSTSRLNFIISADTPVEVRSIALQKVAEKIKTELLENIYPIKVVKNDNGNIFINQGSLKVGSQYNVFSLGEKLYDPYTKEYMGRSESKTGTIEIVRSIAKYSIAQAIDGDVQKGDVCRSITKASIQNNPKDYGGVKKSKSGGVYLPF